MSAAYYAVFHDLTDRAARHLIGSSPDSQRNKIRRSWSHGEITALASIVIDRAKAIAVNPAAPLTKELRAWGPLVDIASGDPQLVQSLKLFGELQERRHRADYDHDETFDKVTLLTACADAESARRLLNEASAAGREAMLALLTVRRSDFRER